MPDYSDTSEMKLLADEVLENSAIVANCRMNRERNLHGTNGYDSDLGFDPLILLKATVREQGHAKWLDLCCGTGKALVEASAMMDAERLPITIVGVDLVGMFDISSSERLQLVQASLSDWKPTEQLDLITCVHGLHYIGDKLGLIARAASWLTPNGKFAANLDKSNLLLLHAADARIVAQIRKAGFSYSTEHKILECVGHRQVQFPFRYLGADDQAGPNYTGQPAVNSHYAVIDSLPKESGHAQ